MPLFRYFVVVGACLLALVFALNVAMQGNPVDPVAVESTASIDKTTIRIAATRAFAPPVIINTNLPTIAPAASVAAVAQGDTLSAKVRDARAEAKAGDLNQMSKNAPKLEPVTARASEPQKKRKVAVRRKSRDIRPQEHAPTYGPPLFAGFFGNG